MVKVITYGTYDLLHYGHIRLLERAKSLGDYLVVGITSDDFDRSRGKINVKQSLEERIANVKATGIADEIIIEEYEGQKIDDIKRLDIDIFTVGSDWKGKFDYLNDYCKVIYLDRTEGVSSSDIRSKERKLKIGLIGDSESELIKFTKESLFVNGVSIESACISHATNSLRDILPNIKLHEDYNTMMDDVDAVYIVTYPDFHYELIKYSLEHKKHVLCESPVGISEKEVSNLYEIAKDNNCVLMESIKTAYALAFSRLLLIVKSGNIGEVVSVDATCTSLKANPGDKRGSLYSWGPFGLLAVFSVLGTDYLSKQIEVKKADNKDIFAKVSFSYPKSVASIKVANGAKSEGELIITGTKGYIYVPAPWWKTDYFEVRYEHQEDNKRYFYQLDGEGIRYTIVSFAKSVYQSKAESYITEDISLAIAKLIEDFNKGIDVIEF